MRRWIVACLCVAPTVAAGAACCAQASAALAQDALLPAWTWPLYDVGANKPRAVAVGDFNRDGILDFATGNDSTGGLSTAVSLLLGRPGGGFEAPLVLPHGKRVADLGVADFNLDGLPDLVVVNESQGTLRAVLNLPGWPECLQGGMTEVHALAIGDLDGGGRPDVVVPDAAQNRVFVFLSDAGGCPSAPLSYPTGARPVDVVVADLDEDGVPDVVTCNETAKTLSVLLGDGGGGLLPAVSVAVGAAPKGLAAADLDGDGHVDIVSANASTPKLALFLGDGAGGLAAPMTIPIGNKSPVKLVVADLEGDGFEDLVISTAAGEVGIVPGQGGGAFGSFAFLAQQLENQGGLAVGDMDGDGRLDLLADANARQVLVAAGDGAGGFPGPQPGTQVVPVAGSLLGDLDGDGLPDLVTTAALVTPALVSVSLGDAAGNWGPPVSQPATGVVMRLADVNGDGALDLLTAGETSLLTSLGDGAGHLAASIETPLALSFPPSGAVTADFDGDGHVDVELVGRAYNLIGVMEYHRKGLRGDGTGHFPTLFMDQVYEYVQFGQTVLPSAHLQVGDIDEDGLPDSVMAWAPFWTSVSGIQPFDTAQGHGSDPLQLVDYDGDGHLDILLADPNNITVRSGTGTGSFAASAVTLAPSDGARTIRLADVDGDGLDDLLFDRPSHRSVAVLLADGAGGHVPVESFLDGQPDEILPRDRDGDGLPDLLTRDYGYLLWLANTSQPTWANLGSGLAGAAGVPQLVGTGPLLDGTAGTLSLGGANPSKLSVLFLSKQSAPAPFKGGVLVPVPVLAALPLVTGADGALQLGWTNWIAGVPGSAWYFQYAVVDAGAPAGAALSNALRATQP